MHKMYSCDALYKLDSSGRMRSWKLECVEERDFDYTVIKTEAGLVLGEKVVNKKIVKSSKVKGHWDRARDLAITKWANKKDSGYCLTPEEAIDWVPTRPMLSKTAYINESDTIKPLLPCLAQVKFDGVRAMWYPKTLTLESRKGKPWDRVPHITDILISCCQDMHLDGELYSHNMALQNIIHCVRTADAVSRKKEIKFFVFDTPSRGDADSYGERLLRLKAWHETLNDIQKELIILPPLTLVHSEKEVEGFFDKAVSGGYEGLMLKDHNAPYHWDKRVSASTKIKPVYTDEFEITAGVINSSTGTGLIEFICKTADGSTFKVVPKWARATREKLALEPGHYDGQKLTVEYRGWTNGKLPVHAVGIAVRNYE